MNIVKCEPARPLRILHQLGSLNRGGIETWLMHVLRRTDRSQFQMDFFVRGAERGEYEDEAVDLGSKIGRSFHHRNPVRFETELRTFIRQNGPYDILHSHLSEYDGVVLRAASRCGVTTRVSHSHNDTRSIDGAAPLHRRTFRCLGKLLIKRYATHCLAASHHSASSQFGSSWASDPRVDVLHCGIDLKPFRKSDDKRDRTLRRELGFPDGAFVIGHVGRFAPQKNHDFLVKTVAVLARKDPAVRLLLVGAGPLQADVSSLVSRSGLDSRVVLLAPRPDVPRLMLEAMDLFALPSLHEGLPLVLIEAQAAALPCVASDAIPEESSVFPGSVEFLSLRLSAEEWANRLLRHKNNPPPKSQSKTLLGSSFDITVSAGRLFDFYSGAVHSQSANRIRSAV